MRGAGWLFMALGLPLGLACGGSTTGGTSHPDAGHLDSTSPGPGTGSGSGSGTSAGAPSLFLTSTLGGGADAGSTGACNIAMPNATFLDVGSETAPVTNGSGISVTCNVAATAGNGGFQMTMYAGTQAGPSIELSGTLTDTPGTSQPGFHASFGSTSGQYSAADCTFTLSTKPSFAPPIAPGRVAGTLSCPMVVDATNSATCAATATFVLQNCSE